MDIEITEYGDPRFADAAGDILGRIERFEPTEVKAIHDALYILWMRTHVKAIVRHDGEVVAITPLPPEDVDPSQGGYLDPDTGIQYPAETCVDNRTMQKLLKAHGVKVTQRQLEEKSGIKWDGTGDSNKWYECLEHYGVEYPWKQAHEAMDRAEGVQPYRMTPGGVFLR